MQIGMLESYYHLPKSPVTFRRSTQSIRAALDWLVTFRSPCTAAKVFSDIRIIDMSVSDVYLWVILGWAVQRCRKAQAEAALPL